MNIKTRLCLSIFTIAAVLILAPVAQSASPSPFVGGWQAIDVDGSDIRLTIAGRPNGPFQITWTESYISFCNGKAGIVRGTGWLSESDPNLLEADLRVECFTTGASMDLPLTFRYHPVTDALSTRYWNGMVVLWHRPGSPPPPPPTMGLRVNYGHDWVESFYEAGHTVWISVMESDGVTVKATAELYTEPKDFWGGETGFTTQAENWDPAPPDIQPYDWVYAWVDNGASAQVQIGDIQGEVYIMEDRITGTIEAPWITDPVPVECLDWGSGGGPFNKDAGTIYTNGADLYNCSWDPDSEWDLQAWQDVGVGYSTPDGHWVANVFQAEHWSAMWTYDLPPGFWSEGEHSYYFKWAYTVPEQDGMTMDPMMMTVSRSSAGGETPIYPGYVLIQPWSSTPQLAWTGSACEAVPVIHPDQPTRFVWGWVNDYSMSYEEALAHFTSFTVEAYWDGEAGGSAQMTMGELLPFTGADARWDYRCSLTEHPPKLDLRVNYGDDWVESFYEAGHMVQISVTDRDGAVKATAEVVTEPKDFWGGETGFTTPPDDWDPAPPDIQPYDWVYAWVDNGASAQVQIGEISGAIDLETDSIQGTIAAPWFSNENEMVVECHPWGSPEPVEMKSDTVLPDGEDPYSCSWPGEWDIQPGQDVGVGYFGPDGHWVANAFSTPDGRIIAFPEAENVFGYGWPEGTEVRMDISGSANFTMLTTVGPSSWDENDILAYFDFNGLYNLVAGDVVTLSGSGTVETHTVRNLSVTGIDVGANTVSGAADDGEVPFVFLFEYPDQIINPSVESGQWIADFNSVGLDLVPDQCGRVDIWDEAGNSTTVDWCTPNTRFTVWPEWNYLEGYEWPDGAVVSISVEGKEACSTEAVSGYPEWDSSNTFFSVNFPEGCTIEVGDLITLSSEPLNLTHQVQDLAVTTVDEANDTVAGTAVFDPEQYILHIWIHGVDGSYMRLSAEGGGWLADFGAKEFDLQPGMGGRVELVDQASNATAAEWWIPKIVIKAFPMADNLWGYGWPEGSEVHLTLNGTFDFVPPATVGPAPWGDPNDIMAYFELTGYNLVPGDVITLSGSGLEQTHTVRNLSVTSVDAVANTVTGTADEELYVWVHGYDGTELHVTPQDGTWLADFGSIPFDLMDGMCGRAEIGDEFGNATAVDWCIPNPRFTVWPESDRMDGGEWPDGPVSVTVEGKPECSTTKISEGGYFNEPFPEGCDITVGDEVTFSNGVTTRSHTVRNLAITGVDETADTVAGTADIGEGVSVGVYDLSGESELQLTVEDGTWLADFTLTGIDLVEGMCGYARVDDEVGNVTQVDWCIP